MLGNTSLRQRRDGVGRGKFVKDATAVRDRRNERGGFDTRRFARKHVRGNRAAHTHTNQRQPARVHPFVPREITERLDGIEYLRADCEILKIACAVAAPPVIEP